MKHWIPEILAAIEMLKAENLNSCLKLLHFHIGSQVPDILTVKKAVQEAARLYAKLHKMGFQIEFLDVGGGLGVDYDGLKGRMLERPSRADIPLAAQEQLIVELYSK